MRALGLCRFHFLLLVPVGHLLIVVQFVCLELLECFKIRKLTNIIDYFNKIFIKLGIKRGLRKGAAVPLK